jgi:hypothetical protein
MINNPAAPYVPGRRGFRPNGSGHVLGQVRFGLVRLGQVP